MRLDEFVKLVEVEESEGSLDQEVSSAKEVTTEIAVDR